MSFYFSILILFVNLYKYSFQYSNLFQKNNINAISMTFENGKGPFIVTRKGPNNLAIYGVARVDGPKVRHECGEYRKIFYSNAV